MTDDKTPILVACAQVIDKTNDPNGPTPIELIARAALDAQQDSGVNDLLGQLDTIACTGLTVDAIGVSNPLSRQFSNVPKTLANTLKIEPKNLVYATTGGNSPQRLVNHYSKLIAQGQAEAVLIAGGEALHTMKKRFNHWSKLLLPKGKWRDKPGGKPESFGELRPSGTPYENSYGLDLPANVYPLFENGLRVHYQRSQVEHTAAIGELFSPLTKVAADNPNAWFQEARTGLQLTTVTASNRMIAYPYTKQLNSMIFVNQAAALVLTSVGKAKAMGISEEKWVYLHGFADSQDIWNVSERENFHSSPAFKQAATQALSSAQKNIDEIKFLDIYSCFPCAVQIACDELGISHQDSRGLSLTGGLPYFGGPGNSYSIFAIAEMMNKLRENPREFGLLNANGWFLTKHSVGIYSKVAPQGNWLERIDRPAAAEIPKNKTPFTESANGEARLETFTVIHDTKGEPKTGVVFGRLKNGARFLAELAGGNDSLRALMQNDSFEIVGKVVSAGRKNKFYL